MRSNFCKIIAGILAWPLLSACTDPSSTSPEEYKIGDPLGHISPLTTRDGTEQSQIAIFDKTVRKIHQFDLDRSVHVRTLTVKDPGSPHYILYEQSGNYVIDLTKKHLTIFNQLGVPQWDPVNFVGNPVSAAFRPDAGFLVVYDDLSSIAVLKIGGNGNVISSWVGGPVLGTADSTVVSGDINDSGQLILGLSDNSVAVVDLNQSLANQSWVLTRFQTNLDRISWIGPLRGNADQALMKDRNSISLVSLGQHSVLQKINVDSSQILKLSRAVDPHIVIQEGKETKIIFASQSQLRTRSRYNVAFNKLIISRLDLTKDYWTFVDARHIQPPLFDSGEVDPAAKERHVSRYRFTDMLALRNRNLPDDAELEITDKYSFALFPSELGYAMTYETDRDLRHTIELFNIPHLKP